MIAVLRRLRSRADAEDEGSATVWMIGVVVCTDRKSVV